MSKIKMRCISCGKWFQSANAKEVTCPDCMQKARKEKLAAKSAPPASTKDGSQASAGAAPRPTIPPKPKPATTTSNHWLDSIQDVKVGQPDQPRPKPSFPSSPPRDRGVQDRNERPNPGGYQDERGSPNPGGNRSYNDDRGSANRTNYREGGQRGTSNYREGGQRGAGNYNPNYRENEYRSPGSYRGIGYSVPGSIGQRPRQPLDNGYNRAPTRPGTVPPGRERLRPNDGPAGKPRPPKKPGPPKAATPPKPKREKIPPPAPFVPTPEQIAKVEERYQELAKPAEFDGIRTQIAQELSIPRKTVKKIVKELRDRIGVPSWWEVQTYKGNEEELEVIKTAYEPYLPLPPIGVHKEIAQKLELKTGIVYQAIKTIRQELKLPQYNAPETHGQEQAAQAAETPEVEKASAEETPASQTSEDSSTSPVEQSDTTGQIEENGQSPQIATSQVTEQSDTTGTDGQVKESDTAIPIDGPAHSGE